MSWDETYEDEELEGAWIVKTQNRCKQDSNVVHESISKKTVPTVEANWGSFFVQM